MTKLLNPAYAALHAVVPGVAVAGGVTAPRGSTGGVSPVAWIRGMKAAGAHLDAYAHNPYPLNPRTRVADLGRLQPLPDADDGDAAEAAGRGQGGVRAARASG